MAKGSRGGKRAKRASNAKYNGFSITRKDGTTSHYKVINGKVQDAIEGEGFDGLFRSKTHHLQPIYDKLGSVDAMIKVANKNGAKASILSDKTIDKMYEERQKKQKEDDKHYSPRNSKKGVNRHRSYWSAM